MNVASNGNLISVAEDMMRDIYKLSESYLPKNCNLTQKSITVVMQNGLIELKAIFPRSIIEDRVDAQAYEKENEEIEELANKVIEEELESTQVQQNTPQDVSKKKSLKKK